jgi:hypothetical protein
MSKHHYPIEPQDRTEFIDELDKLLLAKLEFVYECESSNRPMTFQAREAHSARIRAAMQREGRLYRAFVDKWAGPGERKEQSG